MNLFLMIAIVRSKVDEVSPAIFAWCNSGYLALKTLSTGSTNWI